MTLSNQYEIPYADIPKGIELALKNSDRLRTDAEILAVKQRYNSAIPLITLAVEEFEKAPGLLESDIDMDKLPELEEFSMLDY